MSKACNTLAVLLATGFLLSGCAERLIKQVQAQQCKCAESYCTALRSGYLERASLELAESDQRDAAFFARKADAACRGELVLPQDPKQRRLHEELELDALSYRIRLMKLLSNISDASNENAVIYLAQAQVSYDCWVQEMEEGRQFEDIATCKRLMQENLDAIP